MHLTGRLFDPITCDTQRANHCMLSSNSKVSIQRQPLTTNINGIDWRWGRCGWKAIRCLAVINIWFWLSDDDIDDDDDGREESNDGDDDRGAFLASHQLSLQICPRIRWCLIHSVAGLQPTKCIVDVWSQYLIGFPNWQCDTIEVGWGIWMYEHPSVDDEVMAPPEALAPNSCQHAIQSPSNPLSRRWT